MIPWKFVAILVILILFLIFVGFNLENKTDISFGFVTFTNVPIFLSFVIAFISGAIVTILLCMVSLFKRRKKEKSKEKNKEKKTKEQEGKDKSKKNADKK